MSLLIRAINLMTNCTDGDIRGTVADYLSAEGVLDPDGGQLLVKENGTPNMSVLVDPGVFYVLNDSWTEFSSSLKYWDGIMDAQVNPAISSNPSGSTRIDLVCVKIDTGVTPNANASNVATIVIVEGTPGAGAPALPNNHLLLATVTVANGASSIVNANIADNRVKIFIDPDFINLIDEDDMASDSATRPPSQQSVRAFVGSGLFWADMPGTPTRVSDTQFTITDTGNANNYDSLFQKGVILKWLESSVFQTAMVISSSYAANTVTINIVGDSLTAGFDTMQYCSHEAREEVFIVPGNQHIDTNVSKQWYPRADVYVLSADARVKTAGTTNPTTYDINDDGSTKFTTKPSIASTNTEDLDNVADNPSTAVVKDSVVTVDIDADSDTEAIEGYISLFYYPTEWRYR